MDAVITITPPPDLSIIIPAYNEEFRLPRTLTWVRDYFAGKNISPDRLEILIVDDGSTDNTLRVAEEWAREMSSVRVISNGDNRGKGFSVRHGILEARGRIALFTDADLSSPIEESEKLFAAIEAGNEVAIGSRALDRSLITMHQSGLREVAGMIFNGFVRLSTGLAFRDAQCDSKHSYASPRKSSSSNSASSASASTPRYFFSQNVTACEPSKLPCAGLTTLQQRST